MNKKWASKRITLNLAAVEAEKLASYCDQTGRPATDVIRELVRGLPMPSGSSDATVNVGVRSATLLFAAIQRLKSLL